MRRLTILLVFATGSSIFGARAVPLSDDAVEVPFRFEHNEILIQVAIGRHEPVTMMLDTDTDPSSINLSFAQSSGFKLREIHGQVTGGGAERPQVYLTKLEGVQLGSLPARDLQAVAIDLTKIQDRLGIQVQGVLGNNFLAGRVLQIDYPAKLLRFYRSSSGLPNAKPGQAVFAFQLGQDGDILMAGVGINGKSVKATLDTGSDGTFSLTPSAVEALGLTEAASHGQPETSQGYKGTVQNTRGKVDRIAVGPIDIASPEVVFWGKGAGRDRRPWDVDIGNGFLRDYVVTIDYSKKRIALQKP
jgi:predicted aspartyl protease